MKPAPNFDRVARIYRWSEYLTLGPLLQRTRTHFLPQLTQARNTLVLGDGDGRFLAQLLAHNPNLNAVAVDTSATMLQLLRERYLRASPNARLQTIQASALDAVIPPDTDLIVTHFFLDCLTQAEVDALTKNIAAHTRPGTLWLLSDFAIPTNPVTRPFAKLYIRTLYLAFRILANLRVQSLPNPQAALEKAGFRRIAHHNKLCDLIYTEIWQRQ
jgi:ubiquinone/menaquinone biosynthesis C-methylase UbiE